MAFDKTHLQVNRGVTTANVQGTGITVAVHTYISTTDTIAAILTPGYFPPNFVPVIVVPNFNVVEQPTNDLIFINDLLFIEASDSTGLVKVLGVNPVTLGGNLLGGSSANLIVVPPVTAVDTNTLIISSGTISTEVADAAHPGIVTASAQTFGGVKTFANGILTNTIKQATGTNLQVGDTTTTTMEIGGNGTTSVLVGGASTTTITLGAATTNVEIGSPLTFLNTSASITTFNELIIPGAIFSGPWGPTTFITKVTFQLFNSVVYVSITGVSAAPASVANIISSNSGIIPSAFRPAANRTAPARVFDNAAPAYGTASVTSTGTITVGVGANQGNFTGSGNAGFFDISFSYNL